MIDLLIGRLIDVVYSVLTIFYEDPLGHYISLSLGIICIRDDFIQRGYPYPYTPILKG